ncbi:MAG: DUF4054 domain-containing protein [Hyphomonas sp.]|nr:DUF4054 domain-containing protein [Hyphomonas sp.]
MAYSAPDADALKERYPAFSGVADATIDIWLAEAATECASWDENIRARAEMAYAAHRMVELGVVQNATAMGVTSFRSGDFSATIGETVASRTGYDSTVYGREFKMLMRRYFAGPRPAWTPPTSTDV